MATDNGPIAGEKELFDRLQELEASEERYKTLFNNMPAGVLQVDASHMGAIFKALKQSGVDDIGTYLENNPDLVDFANRSVLIKEVNDAACLMLGATHPSQLIGPVHFLFKDTPGAAENVMVTRANGLPNLTQRLTVETFDGRMIDALLMVSYPQPATAFDRTALVMVDVTEQTRIERELKKMDEEFKRFAKLSILAELSGSVVHEVRQPLTVVLSDVTTTLRWLSSENPSLPKIRQLMGRIEESVHRANEIIQRVQDLAGKSTPSMIDCNINQLVRDAISFTALEGGRQSVRFVTRLDDTIPILWMDAVQIQQLLVNLLINAVQAATHSDREPQQVTVSTHSRDAHLIIDVEDTGAGVADNALADIFNSFVTTKDKGMGMGLSICRAIARSHGGDVSVQNAASGGAIFTVRLPMRFGPLRPQ